MNDVPARVEELKSLLQLQPHVEGGCYHRFYPSRAVGDGDGTRHPLSAIHYLLEAGSVGSWHRVDAEEAWHFVEGDPLELLIFSPASKSLERCCLGPVGNGSRPMAVVPAGAWQAARPLGRYALMTCLVAPGFEYEGFELMAEDNPLASHLSGLAPEIRF
ncbi:cupin domain-containing protein [Dyella sp. C9]|uniref:cupin domain-containing protein n=1 Tax=Dyella sp. C9 TaxID=2202154 RepID=UPI001E4AD5FA|nr:cupin domain-containing protein [Dyella sp. C9]